MEPVAVCIVVNDNYFQTRYCIENLLSKTKVRVRLYIFDNGSTDERLLKYLQELNQKQEHFIQRENAPIAISKAYNILMKNVGEYYLCLIPISVLVNSGWLEDLLASYEKVFYSGVIGIQSGWYPVKPLQTMHYSLRGNDSLSTVWVTDHMFVRNLMFMSKIRLEQAGYFDSGEIPESYKEDDLCFRFKSAGFLNYYIQKQIVCQLVVCQNDEHVLFPEPSPEDSPKFKSIINERVKIQIFEMD